MRRTLYVFIEIVINKNNNGSRKFCATPRAVGPVPDCDANVDMWKGGGGREFGARGMHNEMMIIANGVGKTRMWRAMSDGNNFQFQFNFYVARMELTTRAKGYVKLITSHKKLVRYN